MASVVVKRDDDEDGVLPQVCVVSGGRAEVLVEHRSAAGVPPVGLLLLLLGPVGIVLLLVVDRLMRVEATGLIPMTRAVHDARRAARRAWDRVAVLGLVAAAVGIAGLLAGPGSGGLWWGVAGAGAVVGVVAWCTPSIGLLRGRPDRTGRSVELHGVHPAFAASYRAQDDRRAEARRRAVSRATAPALSRPTPSS